MMKCLNRFLRRDYWKTFNKQKYIIYMSSSNDTTAFLLPKNRKEKELWKITSLMKL